MKKICVFFIAGLTVISAACSSGSVHTANTNIEESDISILTSKPAKADSTLEKVEITLPESLIEGDEKKELIKDSENSEIKIVENSDGTMTCNMSSSEQEKLIKEMEEALQDTVHEMKTGEHFHSVKDVINDQSYTEFIVKVDKEAFESGMDSSSIFVLGFSGVYYQLFNGKELKEQEVKIKVVDAATGEIIQEVLFPEAFKEIESNLQNAI